MYIWVNSLMLSWVPFAMVRIVLFLAAGVPFFIGLAKIDARFIEVYRRSRHYAHRYSATGRWDTPPRPARKW